MAHAEGESVYYYMARDRNRFHSHGPYTCDALLALSCKWGLQIDEPIFRDGEVPLEQFSDAELVKLYNVNRDTPARFEGLFAANLHGSGDVARMSRSQTELLKESGHDLFTVARDIARLEIDT